MKYFIKIFYGLLILLSALILWVFIDKSTNIRNHYSTISDHFLIVTDSIWVNLPNSLWLDLDPNKFKPMDAIIHANEYNAFTKEWNDIVSLNAYYTYHNEAGEPLILQIEEYYKNDNWTSVDTYPLTNHETINNIQISYGKIENEEFQVNLESETKVIKLKSSYRYLDIIKPVIYKAWEIIQN